MSLFRYTPLLRLLIDFGANVDQLTFHTEFTALHFAVNNAHYTVSCNCQNQLSNPDNLFPLSDRIRTDRLWC